MTSPEIREAVLRTILRHENQVFQTYEIRVELGWSEDSEEAHRLHGIIQSLKRDGIVKQTGTSRKRNQYLMLEKPDELRKRLGRIRTKTGNGPLTRSGNGAASTPAAAAAIAKPGPQRVRFLEERVVELEEHSADQGRKLDEILTTLAHVKTQLDDLHREWVS